MSRHLLAACLILAGVVLAPLARSAEEAAAAAPAPTLDGRKYAITLTTSDGEKSEDVVTFADGALSSQGYTDSRFSAGKVTFDDKGAFEATMASPRGSEAIWTGKVTGDTIEGRVLTGVKGRFDLSTFTGTVQP